MSINDKINSMDANRNEVLSKLPEITSGGTDSILASMFRKMVRDLLTTTGMWNRWMDNYLLDPVNGINQNRTDLSTARGNMNKELFNPKLSWRTFCKCLRFMQITRFDLCIRVYHSNGRFTDHIKKVSLGPDIEQQDEQEESV